MGIAGRPKAHLFRRLPLLFLIAAAPSMPDPQLTPGAVADTDPAIVCAPGYSRSHRVWHDKLGSSPNTVFRPPTLTSTRMTTGCRSASAATTARRSTTGLNSGIRRSGKTNWSGASAEQSVPGKSRSRLRRQSFSATGVTHITDRLDELTFARRSYGELPGRCHRPIHSGPVIIRYMKITWKTIVFWSLCHLYKPVESDRG